MASSSGNSISSSPVQNSGSEEGEMQQMMMMDERKRKRMESNRESARRSRMRKQKHLDELMSQADQIKKENTQILQTIDVTTQQFVTVEAENSVLKAQMDELTQRLQSLNDMINYMNTLNGGVHSLEDQHDSSSLDFFGHDLVDFGFNNGYFGNFTPDNNINFINNNNNNTIVCNNPWDLVCLNQPIMATADALQY